MKILQFLPYARATARDALKYAMMLKFSYEKLSYVIT